LLGHFTDEREEKLSVLRAAVDVGIAELKEDKGLSYCSAQLENDLLK